MGCLSRYFLVLAFLCGLTRGQQLIAEQPPIISEFLNIVNHIIELPSDGFTLDCLAKGEPEPKVHWFKDGSVLTEAELPDGLVLTGEQKWTLNFTQPSADLHNGHYHCKASNKWGIAKSEVIHVTNKVPRFPEYVTPMQFEVSPDNILKEAGGTANFRCSGKTVPGEKDLDITWTKNGEVLPEFQDKSFWTIEKVKTYDIASYACNVSSEYGYVYKLVYLNFVTTAPSFLKDQVLNHTVSLGQEVSLKCIVKGYPAPNISWFIETKTLSNTDDFNISQIPSGSELIVKRVGADQNVFVCEAENTLGRNRQSFHLDVVNSTKIMSGPESKTAKVFEDVSMNCTVLSDPKIKLTVIWKRENADINPDGVKFVRDQNNGLTIRNVTFEDAGSYTCLASTPTNNAIETGTLTVIGIAPQIVDGLDLSDMSKNNVVEGDDVEIPCKPTGYPKPTIIWFKGLDRINFSANNRISVSSDGTLKISKATVNDSAKYVCSAKNDYGQAPSASFFVKVHARTRILKAPESVVYQPGGDALLDCHVDVGPVLTTDVKWFKDDQMLKFEKSQSNNTLATTSNPLEMAVIDSNDLADNNSTVEANNTNINRDVGKHYLFANNSLLVFRMNLDDVGSYKCQVTTDVDEIIMRASIYVNDSWWWLIVLIICTLIALILILICCIRRNSKLQGWYGVKDIEKGKKLNRTATDIQYSIDEDAEDRERSLLNPDKSMVKPIYTPKTLKGLSEITKGSENSLLNLDDEEINLRKGMGEDGSFKGAYLE